jgi:hypothetical protein
LPLLLHHYNVDIRVTFDSRSELANVSDETKVVNDKYDVSIPGLIGWYVSIDLSNNDLHVAGRFAELHFDRQIKRLNVKSGTNFFEEYGIEIFSL